MFLYDISTYILNGGKQVNIFSLYNLIIIIIIIIKEYWRRKNISVWHTIIWKYVFFNDIIPREVGPLDFCSFIAIQLKDYNFV